MSKTLKLVSRAKKGDTSAFQKLVSKEKDKLYKMAYVYMKSEENALEVFQETIYKALKAIPTLQNEQYFSTWITRILINTAIETLRKRKNVIPMRSETLESFEKVDAIKREEKLDLLDALDMIEEKYKTVLLLRYYKDYTIRQIAEILDSPEGTVKTNIRRGLASLKPKMKGVYVDDR